MPIRQFVTRLSILSASLPALAACSSAPVDAGGSQAQHASEDVAITSDALRGALTTDSCSAAEISFLQKTMNVGNFVATTPYFQACIQASYVACSQDDQKTASSVITATQSPNVPEVQCSNLGAPTLGQTSSGDEHGWVYSGNEKTSIDTTFLDGVMNAFNANTGSGDFYGAFDAAGVIWHEVMHVHGYQHGDNSNAANAASNCGQSGNASWFWRTNSAPYAVERCMGGAYLSLGALGSDGPPSDTFVGFNNSIVEQGFADHHKRGNATTRTKVFNAMVAGGYTWAKFQSDVALNSIPSGAFPVTVGGTLNDELFDNMDRDYYTFTLAHGDRVRVTLGFPSGTPLPGLYFDGLANGGALPAGSSERIYTSGATTSTMTLDLAAGTYLFHVDASGLQQSGAASTTIAIIPVVPVPPSGCAGSMLCDGTVNVRCNPSADPLLLERLDGSAWVTAGETDDTAGPLLPSLSDSLTSTVPYPGFARTYRVCQKSFSPTLECSSTFPVTVYASKCSVPVNPPHTLDCSNKLNWHCTTLPGGKQDCHCGPTLNKVAAYP